MIVYWFCFWMSIYHWLPSMIVIQLRNIKLNHSADGTLTNRAKLRVSVCFHATVVGRTINTFSGIAASFIYSYRIFLSFSNRSRDRSVWRKHIFPFGSKVYLCWNILFPRFDIQWISIRHHIILIKILVGQSAEAVSEFVHYHRFEHGVMSCGQRIRIVYSSSAVYICVSEDNDMLVRDTSQCIVDRLYPAGSQIAIWIKGCLLYTSPSPRDTR